MLENSGESSVAASARRSSISKLVRNTCPDVRRISKREARIRCCSSRVHHHHPRSIDTLADIRPILLLEPSSRSTAISSRRAVSRCAAVLDRQETNRRRTHSPRSMRLHDGAAAELHRPTFQRGMFLSTRPFFPLPSRDRRNTCSLLVEARTKSFD